MKALFFLLTLLACAPAWAADPAEKARRLALVIGNGAYRDAPLANPLNDAADMAKALEASGFTVIKRENASLRDDMHLALREFGDKLGRQSTGLFYFAGHGLQVRGRNYLLPVDADVAREDEVAFAALDLGAVMEKLDSAKNPVNIVILDACRNNPFGTKVLTTSKGLAQVDAPPGTFIAFATAPGSTAADGGGRNGLYTQHLVGQMAKPGLMIEEVFRAVRAGVRADSRSLQVPWESTSLESAFLFRQKPPPPPAPKPAPVVAAANPSAPRAVEFIGAPPRFAVGDNWSYRVINQLDQSERNLVYRITKISGDHVEYSNGSVADSIGNYTKIARSGGRVETYTPYNPFYVFPLKAGNSWDVAAVMQQNDRVSDIKVKVRVVGEEEIKTTAGTMRAVRVERDSTWKERNGKNAGQRRWTYWYNAGAKRYVRAEDLNTALDGKILNHEVWDLVAYDVQ